MGRLGKRLFSCAFAIILLCLHPSSAFANSGLLACWEAKSGARFQLVGGTLAAAYQLNQVLVTQLRALGVQAIEETGLGRFVPVAGWVYKSERKNAVFFNIQREDGNLVMRVYSNHGPGRTGMPTATLHFQAKNCQI